MSEQENQQPQGDETGGQVGEGALNSEGEQTEAERQQAEADEDDE